MRMGVWRIAVKLFIFWEIWTINLSKKGAIITFVGYYGILD
jgi:hypothetical protein